MKTLVIAAALIAFVCAHERPSNMRERLENFESKRAERQEKWNELSEEERQKIRNEHQRPAFYKDIPADVREKLHEAYGSLSTEQRQKLHESVKARFAANARPNMASMSEEGKQKVHEKFVAIRERLSSLPEEERKQEIQKLRNEHHERFQNFGPHPSKEFPVEVLEKMREIHASVPTEQRQKFHEDMKEKFAAKARQDFEKLSDENKQRFRSKFAPLHEKLSQLPAEERKAVIRQGMIEKFESLSPEERQKFFNKLHRNRFPENNVVVEHSSQFSEALNQNLHKKLEKLSPEQLEEIRKQLGARPRVLKPGRSDRAEQE